MRRQATSLAYLAHAALVAGAEQQQQRRDDAVPTTYFPLNYYYGYEHKISTNFVMPWNNNMTVEVVFDQGSDNFWIFGPNSTMNWGCTSLFCPGPCNMTVTPFYDYPASPTASAPQTWAFASGYGGFSKIVQGLVAVNDTMVFTNVAGQETTVTDVKVAVADYMTQRINDAGTCQWIGNYDQAIMGIAPFQKSPEYNTSGPSVRQDLLERGVIDAPVMSMWFDEIPDNVTATWTGGAIFGAIDTSKFTGPLVKVPLRTNDQASGGASVGYYTPIPRLTVNGTALDQSDLFTGTCLLDSGTQVDDLPISLSAQDAFYKAAGFIDGPTGGTAWPGPCDSIPKDLSIDLEFDSVDNSTSVMIKIPFRNYVRSFGDKEGACTLNIDFGGCTLAGPFATATFFAADDERGEIALAQGGVSAMGSGPDYTKVVARIP